jgi:hypothetical protein
MAGRLRTLKQTGKSWLKHNKMTRRAQKFQALTKLSPRSFK